MKNKSNFKDPFGPKHSKGSFNETTKSLVRGAITLAIALPLIGALTGGHK